MISKKIQCLKKFESMSMRHTFIMPTVTRIGLFLALFLLAIMTVGANVTTTTTLFSVRDEAIMEKFTLPCFHRPVLNNKMRDNIGSNIVTAEKVTDETSSMRYNFSLDISSRLMVKKKKLGKNNIDRSEKREKKRKKKNPASLYKIKRGSTVSSTVSSTFTDSSIMDKASSGTRTKNVPRTTSLISMVLFVPLDSQDCRTLRSEIYMNDDLFDT